MLRKRRRISESIDDDPMSGIVNLSDAMLVLALGFLIFAPLGSDRLLPCFKYYKLDYITIFYKLPSSSSDNYKKNK